jgi:glycosyltransferase involved in cell wall biosynthesis
MAEQLTPSNPPLISVIIPARNEEDCLGSCLESLTAQTGVSFEIIVVNDHSDDRTVEVAQGFPQVTIVDAGELPEGWSGKNNALTAGVKKALGSWFLFTDADTTHLPGSLAASFSEALQRRADLLSYSPAQEVWGFSEKAVMPVIFAELGATYRPARVSDPKSRMAAANGQYILVSRRVYENVGGHAAVAQSLLEDVALARAIKHSGGRIFFRYGGDAVRTRMYRNFVQLRDGWTKNLVLLFPSAGRLATLRLIEFILIVGGAALSVFAYAQDRRWVAAAAALMTVTLYGFLLKRIARAHFAWDANAIAVFGLPLFAYLLLRSKLSYVSGNVSWKGRTYGSARDTSLPGQTSLAADQRTARTNS